MLVEGLEDERDDPGRDAKEQEDADDGHPGEIGQDDGQRSHDTQIPVRRADGDEQMRHEILDSNYNLRILILKIIVRLIVPTRDNRSRWKRFPGTCDKMSN